MDAELGECRQVGPCPTKRHADNESLVERKRKQSRESTRRWRANEHNMLEALRNQVSQLERALQSKLSVGGSVMQGVSTDGRMEKLLATKRFYVAQNMRLLAAIKMRQEHASSIIGQLRFQPSLQDDAFLLYMAYETQEKLKAMDLRSQFQGTVREINGISCIALTRGASMDYDMEKYYAGVNHLIMGDVAWAAYQEKAIFMPLVDRVIDHSVIRRVHDNMLVIQTTSWTVEQELQHRFLILQRARTHETYSVTVTALNPSLTPAPHAFRFGASDITNRGFKSHVTGTCCLQTGSPDEAKVTIEGMVRAQCRLEAYVRAHTTKKADVGPQVKGANGEEDVAQTSRARVFLRSPLPNGDGHDGNSFFCVVVVTTRSTRLHQRIQYLHTCDVLTPSPVAGGAFTE
ncbi:hypothetical protein, variant 3 [Aphanomyces invadans]|uniref:Uncharacterized protein n=2 Tax=Aphanomyces invadans TaxID=157072 RepID=A0A024USI8_9STRA|nr:hypothetical protein, variant 3 [Aphanomyces invadans]ETW09466.1 hypothetical protein, variant 3 [Aphanomyces invadans]|eukprot:XP_008860875.1 hypothetical protein, variant 3 [Aphanomyces invadans]